MCCELRSPEWTDQVEVRFVPDFTLSLCHLTHSPQKQSSSMALIGLLFRLAKAGAGRCLQERHAGKVAPVWYFKPRVVRVSEYFQLRCVEWEFTEMQAAGC